MREVVCPKSGEVIRRIKLPNQRVRQSIEFFLPTMTVNSHKDETDINNIVNRYQRTGILPPSERAPIFADVTHLQGDLTERIQASQMILDAASDNDAKLDKQRAEAERLSKLNPPSDEKPDTTVPDNPKDDMGDKP